jgi:hypothetical protein
MVIRSHKDGDYLSYELFFNRSGFITQNLTVTHTTRHGGLVYATSETFRRLDRANVRNRVTPQR